MDTFPFKCYFSIFILLMINIFELSVNFYLQRSVEPPHKLLLYFKLIGIVQVKRRYFITQGLLIMRVRFNHRKLESLKRLKKIFNKKMW
ncbi:hypothetical protein CVD28_09975 [Bacillus sp. M6-12]|nr:hypothetical protein CVD28_09975 [Bacillus sp. M6-12]